MKKMCAYPAKIRRRKKVCILMWVTIIMNQISKN